MRNTIILILLVVATVLSATCFYTIDEREQVIVTLFGEVVQVQKEPGIRFKGPILWKVHRFPDWVLEWDGPTDQIPTRDKKFIFVDNFARWRIADVEKFYVSVRTETGAQTRLDDIIDGATRDVVTDHDLIEVVRNTNRELIQSGEGYGTDSEDAEVKFGRDRLARMVLERAASQTLEKYGIELLDVQFKRINYIEEVQRKVFDRMISERKRIAELFRAEGRKAASEIEGQKERELQRIGSEAFMIAEQTRGDADAEAIGVYADAYSRDPDFYAFMKTLESYKKVFDGQDTVVLDSGGEYLKYLESLR